MESNIRIKKTNDGEIEVYTPYNKKFVDAIKMVGGHHFDWNNKCWVVPEECIDDVRDIMMDIYDREHGMLPVSVIDKPLTDRMASTIRHNRARGSHDIELMTNIVAELKKSGMSDAWIMKNIGMDAEELLRLKQLSGLQELFKDKDFSKSWEAAQNEEIQK